MELIRDFTFRICLAAAAAGAAVAAHGQASAFSGSVAAGSAVPQTLELTLDDAITRGLRNNLGAILANEQKNAAGGQKLQALQPLLPSVDGSISESLVQADLAAEGLRIPGFPKVIGPYGYTDLRARLNWSLVNLASLRRYMAAKHYFAAAGLTARDARQMVILAVGNAYFLAVADQARVASVEAEMKAAQDALHDAAASHEAGTAPRLDELRARVDYQREQQLLISANNELEKDKLALARVIGLPLDQKFTLSDANSFTGLDALSVEGAGTGETVARAQANRADLASLKEETQGGAEERKAATADRLPTLNAEADYGDIGVNVNSSHGTVDAAGSIDIPLFREAQFRGESLYTQAQLDQLRAELSDKNAQVDADVRDALLDLQAARKLVEVARSNVDVSSEALSEARLRYTSGVGDNLGVSEALASYALADTQMVASQYQYNMARLSLARALGDAENYKQYLGGK